MLLFVWSVISYLSIFFIQILCVGFVFKFGLKDMRAISFNEAIYLVVLFNSLYKLAQILSTTRP